MKNFIEYYMRNRCVSSLFLCRFFVVFFDGIRFEHKRDSLQYGNRAKRYKHCVNHIPLATINKMPMINKIMGFSKMNTLSFMFARLNVDICDISI